MKICKVDKLGMVVIPMSFRRELGITTETPISIDLVDSSVVITICDRLCKLCGKKIHEALKIQLCEDCIKSVKNY